jgi:phosphatidylserine/phosphatidylglycerophosphate/cardiolipin synthase-like enzyme
LGILEDEIEFGRSPVVTANIDKNSEIYVTEELYIHSKLLIADDRIVLCGSGK